MSAAPAMPLGPRPEVQLLRDFTWIDLHGINGCTAEVEYRLGTGQMMSMSAGGSGVHASPGPSYPDYEVIFDADPPRFWRKYTDDAGMVYAFVPRTLLTHYVVRNGGIEWRSDRVIYPKRKPPLFFTGGACIRW